LVPVEPSALLASFFFAVVVTPNGASEWAAAGEDSPGVFGQIEAAEFGIRDPACLGRVVTGPDVTGKRPAGEDDEHIVPLDPALTVAGDDLGAVDLPGNGDKYPGFFAHLAAGGVFQALAQSDATAREAPVPGIGCAAAPDEENLAVAPDGDADAEMGPVGIAASIGSHFRRQ
jgi:hypothetical protein